MESEAPIRCSRRKEVDMITLGRDPIFGSVRVEVDVGRSTAAQTSGRQSRGTRRHSTSGGPSLVRLSAVVSNSALGAVSPQAQVGQGANGPSKLPTKTSSAVTSALMANIARRNVAAVSRL